MDALDRIDFTRGPSRPSMPAMQSLLDPTILFFVLGVLAGALKSNLEIPAPISKFLSLYLLMALGLKGGFALAASGLDARVLASLGAAMAMALVVPAFGYRLLRRHCGDVALIQMCALILRDEAGHIRFHRDRLAGARLPGRAGLPGRTRLLRRRGGDGARGTP